MPYEILSSFFALDSLLLSLQFFSGLWQPVENLRLLLKPCVRLMNLKAQKMALKTVSVIAYVCTQLAN